MDGRSATASSLMRVVLRRIDALEAHPAWTRAGRQHPELPEALAAMKLWARRGLGHLAGRRPISNEALGRLGQVGERSAHTLDDLGRYLDRLRERESAERPL